MGRGREGDNIGGDFNIRIGELGGMETEEIEVGRRIKDKVINNG